MPRTLDPALRRRGRCHTLLLSGRSSEVARCPRSRPTCSARWHIPRASGYLEVLGDGERGVSELQPLVGIESSHLSQQLGILRRASLVTSRKDGSAVVYAVRDPELVALLASARRLLINAFTETRDLLDDLLDERPG